MIREDGMSLLFWPTTKPKISYLFIFKEKNNV